ncbi:CotY/CotZ family spore coat protein [Psychrobacillus soli]|uniref:CotY/CotZ family spore coat protein n=1 Tax=Psychrobacillus soli TaxID=1543965 RepID=UPI00163C0D90|nr:CotY/CotZ family spore coat protein [Psychrobacillus soli]
MKNKLSGERESNHCLCDALYELKSFQDLLESSKTRFFGHLFAKIAGTDTIPLLLISKNGEPLSFSSTEECFETNYFRIESIDRDTCCTTISLLRPLDIEGNFSNSFCDVVKLEKTSICKTVDLSCICAIQLLETELLTRKIIIEPKW